MLMRQTSCKCFRGGWQFCDECGNFTYWSEVYQYLPLINGSRLLIPPGAVSRGYQTASGDFYKKVATVTLKGATFLQYCNFEEAKVNKREIIPKTITGSSPNYAQYIHITYRPSQPRETIP
jgi:hypothetical protein